MQIVLVRARSILRHARWVEAGMSAMAVRALEPTAPGDILALNHQA